MRCALLLSMLAMGCESGLTEHAEISISQAAQDAFTQESPGVLRTDLGLGASMVAALCGQAIDDPIDHWHSQDFACLGETKGTEVTRGAWIEPLPEGWDAQVFCADGDAQGDGIDLVAEPKEDWFQGVDTAEWRRDSSPCGGRLDVEILVE